VLTFYVVVEVAIKIIIFFAKLLLDNARIKQEQQQQQN
jgi:hypothetical protein